MTTSPKNTAVVSKRCAFAFSLNKTTIKSMLRHRLERAHTHAHKSLQRVHVVAATNGRTQRGRLTSTEARLISQIENIPKQALP